MYRLYKCAYINFYHLMKYKLMVLRSFFKGFTFKYVSKFDNFNICIHTLVVDVQCIFLSCSRYSFFLY